MVFIFFFASLSLLAGATVRYFRRRIENRAGKPFDAAVARVVDGDTVDVMPAGGSHLVRLRLKYIDAPEMHQEFGPESAAALESLVGSTVVVVPFCKDVYGRLLAEIGINGQSVNLGQVRYGMAWACPDAPWVFRRAMHAAKREDLGLWAGLTTMPPWEYRARVAA